MNAERPPALLRWMSVLADATRARILRVLEQTELTVAELCAVLASRRPANASAWPRGRRA
jgi:DNA-binding transcriptional ArsR family regulator